MKLIFAVGALFLVGSMFLDMPVTVRAEVEINRSIKLRKHGEGEEAIFEIPSGKPIPTVKLRVIKDTKKGWNLDLETSNFTFAPAKVNQPEEYREGHAHLYINGKKITRIYSDWFYLPALEPGRNEITVSLNTNDHKTLVLQGKKITDTVIVDVR
jgi:hypothetical protein